MALMTCTWYFEPAGFVASLDLTSLYMDLTFPCSALFQKSLNLENNTIEASAAHDGFLWLHGMQ